jgi:hypothetical protein
LGGQWSGGVLDGGCLAGGTSSFGWRVSLFTVGLAFSGYS